MKSKHYWEDEAGAGDPFGLTRRMAKGLAELAETHATQSPCNVVKYLWIYITDEGMQRRRAAMDESGCLRIDDWLNVIDESAALGAEWVVIHVSSSLCQCPEIWKLCQWAQEQHELRTGLHLSSACLSEDDVEQLTHLDPSKTYLIGDENVLNGLRSLRDLGLQFCEATVGPHARMASCTNPQELVCVGIDGRLSTCGLVLGEENYHLGNVLDRGLKNVLQDTSLPHAIEDTSTYPSHGCDGCPPHVAQRVASQLSR